MASRARIKQSVCALEEQPIGVPNPEILSYEGTSGHDKSRAAGTVGDESGDGLEDTIRFIALKLYGSLPKPSSVELTDLLQAGNVGLLQARRSYDPALGVPLAAFARFRIRGEMLEALHRSSPLGNHVRGANSPGPVRMVPVEGWRETYSGERQEWIPERQLWKSQHRRILTEEMKRMPLVDRTVLELKYAEDFTLRQIGSLMRVKESRACQIHRRALLRLRKALGRLGVDHAA